MMKLSAAELVIASRVAFIVSEDIFIINDKSYNISLFNNINARIDKVLSD